MSPNRPVPGDIQAQSILDELAQLIAQLPDDHQNQLNPVLQRLKTELSVKNNTGAATPSADTPGGDAAARDAYLIKLVDQLRTVADPLTIEKTITQTALHHFTADRCYYCEIIGDDAVIRRESSKEGLPSVERIYPLNTLPAFKTVIEAGRPFVVEDATTSTILDESLRQNLIQLQIISFIDVPVIKEGKPIGILCITLSTPRKWTDFEIDLAVETAELIWEAVERARTEKNLRLSEEKYRTLFNSMDQGFCIIKKVDTPPGQPLDFRYIAANPAFESHTGLFDVVGKTVRDLQHNPEPERMMLYDQVLQTGHHQHFQSYAKSLDLWIEAHAYPVQAPGQIAVLFTNINQHKRAQLAAAASEEALRESEERFRQLADAMPQLVWTAQPDGMVDYYNRRYQEYDGIGPLEENIWEWSPVLHPEDQQATVDVWDRAVKTGEVYQIEHRVRMNDGTYRWHLSRGIPAKDDQGNIIRWYGTATDIHIQKENEEKVKRSNQELEQFAFIASHDLQEPLRKIIMFGNSLERQLHGQMNETAADYLNRMQNAAERMQVMINGLLELSRVNSKGGDFTRIDLKSVLDDVVSDLEARIRVSNAQIIIGDLPTVEADELQMRLLFQNLIGNAIKFQNLASTPVINIFAENHQQTDEPQMVEIRVQDNGIGFLPEHVERIFQPFQRLHGRSAYEGSGLGLSIARKIVERHQGQIVAHSTPDQGSTFVITLPIKQNLS